MIKLLVISLTLLILGEFDKRSYALGAEILFCSTDTINSKIIQYKNASPSVNSIYLQPDCGCIKVLTTHFDGVQPGQVIDVELNLYSNNVERKKSLIHVFTDGKEIDKIEVITYYLSEKPLVIFDSYYQNKYFYKLIHKSKPGIRIISTDVVNLSTILEKPQKIKNHTDIFVQQLTVVQNSKSSSQNFWIHAEANSVNVNPKEISLR